jgi:hypothetical protein
MHLTQLAREYGDKPAYIVADCGARLLVASSDLEELAAAAASSAPALRGRLTVGPPVPGVESLADAIAPMPQTPVPDDRLAGVDPDRVGRGGSAITTTPPRPSARTTTRAGARSATWARSMPTDTCTSLTGAPT